MCRQARLWMWHARARTKSLAECWAVSSRAASSPAQACCANCHATGRDLLPDPGQPATTWASSALGGLLIPSQQPALAFHSDQPRRESGPAHATAWQPICWADPSMHPHVPNTALPDVHHARSERSTHLDHTTGQHVVTWGVSGQHSSFAASGMWLGRRRSHGTPLHLNRAHPPPLASHSMPSGWPCSHRHLSTHGVQHQATQEGVEACTTVLAASVGELGDAGGGALAGGGGLSRPSGLLGVLQEAALGVQWVHDATGLPWWASIPLTTLAVRTALLPFSMWQARTVRTNYQVYREAVELTDKQLGAIKETASPLDAMEQASRVRRGKLLLSNFGLLRTKISAPHPAWILINPLVQMPVFVLLGGSLRLMAGVQWPGLTEGGTLWFRDMTQAALIPGSPVFSLDPVVPWELPMGLAGLILPLAMSTMTLTSLRLGFGAAGVSLAPLPKDTMGRFLRILPYVLYSLTILNTWVALQLPHAPLMHWVASSSFTLGLQLALQQPRFRAAFSLPSPSELQAVLTRAVNQRLLQLSEMGGTLGPGRGYALSLLPDALIQQVSQEQDADVLVVLGAQHSAQKRYREALYCLDKALQIQPTHVRAHYSRGQVFSLNNRWTDAESCFRRAAELAGSPGEKGQALYCIATALHTQGKLEGAVEAYRAALPVWTNQPVVSYSLANALMQLGRPLEAKAVVDAILCSATPVSGPHPAGAFLQPLKALAGQIEAALQQLETGSHEEGKAGPTAA